MEDILRKGNDMCQRNVKKKVILFGAGQVAKKKYFLLRDLFQIECFYDNNEQKCGKFLYNVPIKRWERTQIYIIITTDFWIEIAMQLESVGLELGKNYLPYYLFDDFNYSSFYYLRKNFLDGKYLDKEMDYIQFLPKKQVAVVYGNCQTVILESALMLSREFNEDYIVIRTPKIWEYNFEPDLICFFLNDIKFWRIIDLFIYQFVKKGNSFFDGLASDYCIEKLSTRCQRVNITSLYFYGYFPQVEKGNGHNTIFAHRDKYVDELIERKVSPKDILSILCDEQFIADEEIENCIADSLMELKKRDSFADIKICDYIEKNYRKEQMFYSPYHPCDKLLKKYIKRIYSYLGLRWTIKDEEFEMMCCGEQMRMNDIPIYPSVLRKFGFKNCESRYYFNKNYISKSMTLDFRQCMEIYIESLIEKEC